MRLLLVDDHALFREGLRALLQNMDASFELDPIDEAANCTEALEQIARSTYDIILLDFKLPGVSGLEALSAVRDACAETRTAVVVVSGEDAPATVVAAIDAGAAGFVGKSVNPGILVAALGVVIAGGVYLPAEVLAYAGSDRRMEHALTARQIDVLRGVVAAKSNKVIARELGITEHTVKRHIGDIFKELSVRNRTELAIVAAKLDLGTKIHPGRPSGRSLDHRD